jgi:hypothetical protein
MHTARETLLSWAAGIGGERAYGGAPFEEEGAGVSFVAGGKYGDEAWGALGRAGVADELNCSRRAQVSRIFAFRARGERELRARGGAARECQLRARLPVELASE